MELGGVLPLCAMALVGLRPPVDIRGFIWAVENGFQTRGSGGQMMQSRFWRRRIIKDQLVAYADTKRFEAVPVATGERLDHTPQVNEVVNVLHLSASVQ
jgi:hypothetical protein